LKIQLHDLIGIKSGTHFYLNTFSKKLKCNNIDVIIKSNYGVNKEKAFYPNVFNGSLIKNLFLLLVCYIKFFWSLTKLTKHEIVIVSLYGTYIDFGLLLISLIFKKKVLLDVHEVVMHDFKNQSLGILFKYAFRNCKNSIIVHSDKTLITLQKFGYKKKVIYTPHIHYEINKLFNLENVHDDVGGSFLDGYLYFLFFGNIMPSKGIYDLLSAIEKIDFNNSKARVIIAGQDNFNNIETYNNLKEIKKKSKLFLRYINDDEMKYLFTKSNYVLLPYIDISQSGVLEMAINFKKPVLTSNLKFFQNILNTHSSFGKYINTKNSTTFAKLIESEALSNDQMQYYTNTDTEKYFNDNEFDNLIIEIKNFLIDS